MHALGLYMAALRAEPDDAARVELIGRMDASVGALDGLFDALLDVSRIDAGAIEPLPRVFALEPLLHRLGADFATQAADKGLRLAVRVTPAVRGLNAFSDPLLVERILRNLLSPMRSSTPRSAGCCWPAGCAMRAVSPRTGGSRSGTAGPAFQRPTSSASSRSSINSAIPSATGPPGWAWACRSCAG